MSERKTAEALNDMIVERVGRPLTTPLLAPRPKLLCHHSITFSPGIPPRLDKLVPDGKSGYALNLTDIAVQHKIPASYANLQTDRDTDD